MKKTLLVLAILLGACSGGSGGRTSEPRPPASAISQLPHGLPGNPGGQPVESTTTTTGDPTGLAVATVQAYVSAVSDGRVEDAYAWIIPGEREHVTFSVYKECMEEGGAFQVDSLTLVRAADVSDIIPDVGAREGKALTMTITSPPGLGVPTSDVDTFHAYQDSGKWWVTLSGYDTFKAGGCP